MAKRKKKPVQCPPSSPEPGAPSESASPDGKEQGIRKSPLPRGRVDPGRDALKPRFAMFNLSRGGGYGETLRRQGTRPDQLVRNKCSMRSQARASLSKRTLFHGVILIKLSETAAKCLQGFRLLSGKQPPWMVETSPSELLTKSVFRAGQDSGIPETLLRVAAGSSLSGQSNLLP